MLIIVMVNFIKPSKW